MTASPDRPVHGFTLIELMIVVAIIAIIASIAIPNLLSARLRANESAAIAALKGLASAQQQCRTGAEIDVNGNGAGEFGFGAELAGLAGIRTASGAQSTRFVQPALFKIPTGDTVVFANGTSGGAMLRGGYRFAVFLPSGARDFIPEFGDGGASPANNPDATQSESLWCAYAWPEARGQSGNRAFFINQAGDILAARNNTAANSYSGVGRAPAPNSAYVAGGSAADMSSTIAINATGQDGQRWIVVN